MAAACLEGIGEFSYAATYLQQSVDMSQRNLAAQVRGFAGQPPGTPEPGGGAEAAGQLTIRLSAP
jgi:hypothetical protein